MLLFVCSTIDHLVSENFFFYRLAPSPTTGFLAFYQTLMVPGKAFRLLLRIILNSFKKYIELEKTTILKKFKTF